MKIAVTFPLILISLQLAGCAGNPPQDNPVKTRAEVLQKIQGMKAEDQQIQAMVEPPAQKSIVPNIHETGRRGEIARKMLERSTELFLRADINHDYRISDEEAKQHLPHVSNSFSRYDKDKDAGVSWQEFLGHDEWPQPSHTNTGR